MHPVTELIAGLDDPARTVLERCRIRTLELVPDAVEGISYGIPTLLYRGSALVAVAVTKSGYSAYPFSGRVITALADALTGIAHTKGAVQFTDAHPLPPAAFDALVLARRAEIDATLDRAE